MLHRSAGIGNAGKYWRAAATSRPRPGPLADACDELERGLGAFGFQWLCACAVYPDLRFPLTVHLGRCLAEFVNRPLPDENEHLALLRLPWFRTGWMPEDLRLELLQRLQPDMQPLVREAIEQVLWDAHEGWDPGAALGLEFVRPRVDWLGRVRAWLKSAANAEPARDAIFVHYMLGRVLKPNDLRLNRAFIRLFGARLAGYLDRRTLIWLVAALFGGVTLWSFAQVAVEPLFTTTKDVMLTAPEMVAIPGGAFLMGSPENEADRDGDEGPQHKVTINPFDIGKYEVTFAEWDACVAAGGCNGYRPADEGWGRDRHPVVNVSWRDAQAYVEWLARATGKPYRLPTEAEWEYAGRAGTKTRYAFGNEIGEKDANFGNKLSQATEVGSYPPNAWGLHDMHGNVREWVEDVWHDNYEAAPANGSAWTDGEGEKPLAGASFAAAPGTTVRGTSAPPTATGIDPTIGWAL